MKTNSAEFLFAIGRRVACLNPVAIAATIVITSSSPSWAEIAPLVIGFLVIGVCLLCLPMRRGAMISLMLLPWSTIIGSSKIHFSLGASVFVFHMSGSPAILLCIYSVVLAANLICLWNAFIPPPHAVPRLATWGSIVLSMLAIAAIREGPSWLAICISEGMILVLLDRPSEADLSKAGVETG